MATINDIYNALGEITQAIIYPNGPTEESIIDADVKIVKGWPMPEELDADLADGKAQVSIFKLSAYERKSNYLGRLWRELSRNEPTLSATVNNNAITILGIVSVPQQVAIVIDDVVYHYNVQLNDTLNSIAANLSGLIPGALAINNIIYIANFKTIAVRIGVFGKAGINVKRQEQGFMISCWTNNPDDRDILANALDAEFAYIKRLSLPDQLAALRYMKTQEIDVSEKQNLYRRDLYYTVEYETLKTQEFPTITEIKVNEEVGN